MTKGTYHKEIIGQHIKITQARNKNNLGLKGQVIDETRNTLRIKTKKGSKTLIKKEISFIIKETGKKIKGSKILKRPEERLKE